MPLCKENLARETQELWRSGAPELPPPPLHTHGPSWAFAGCEQTQPLERGGERNADVNITRCGAPPLCFPNSKRRPFHSAWYLKPAGESGESFPFSSPSGDLSDVFLAHYRFSRSC